MFKKIIEFSAPQEYCDLKEDYPTPIKNNIPEWYKKLQHSFHNKTIKGCMPFLDTLTSGYLLKIAQDIVISHNVKNEEGVPDSYQFVNPITLLTLQSKQLNVIGEQGPSFHPIQQLGDSPLVEKNKGLSFHKILNPWTIKTPPGYSCLFLPPMNNQDDRFSILPGIVDTDRFYQEVNFPVVFNGDKYETLNTTLKKGTPYVQVFPFKRDNWKMEITPQKKPSVKKIFFYLSSINIYKTASWIKKSWS
jgi:hypothetical protein